MKNIDYDIPIFESNDLADLDLYSEKMATAIKGQIDKFGNPLAFKGIKQNISELDLISNPQSGDIYGVVETNKNYIWNGKEWIIYSDIMELDNYYSKEEINQKIENIQALPTGGTKGQVLTKQSETNGDANWEDIEANEVFVGNEKEAPSSAKIIVEEDDFVEGSTLGKAEVYVGAEEPTAGEKVWFRKGKNVFNAYSSDISYYLRNTDKEKYTINNSNSIKVEGTGVSWNRLEITISNLKANTKYTINSIVTNTTQGYAGLLCDYGNNSVQYVSNKEKFNAKITIVTDENGKVKLQFYTNYSSTTQNSSAIFSEIQLEEGEEATTYEAYIEPKLLLRNSNGVYEEFAKKSEEVYSTEETKIGTWIDGKPLYRKVLSLTTPSTTNSTKIANFDKTFIIKNYYGNAFISASNQLLPINFYFTDVYKIATYVVNNSGEIYMKIGSEAYRNQQATLTIEYTKTTD